VPTGQEAVRTVVRIGMCRHLAETTLMYILAGTVDEHERDEFRKSCVGGKLCENSRVRGHTVNCCPARNDDIGVD
jgi:hypothetical protein